MTLALLSPSQSDTGEPEDFARVNGWIERICRKDRAALRSLYDATSARLMGIAVRVLDDEGEAADVLQDVYLKVWQHPEAFDGRGSALGWLAVVTRNASLDRLKSRRRKREDLRADPDDSEEDQRAEPAVTLGIQHCLSRLNEQAREAILLSYIHGYSHRELEERLSRPLGTIKAWIRRGLQELKQCLEA